MRIYEFLSELREAGIELRVESGRLICNAPRGSADPQLIARIRERRDEFLAFFKRTETEEASQSLPPIARRERSGPLPLSFSQQRAWFLEQLQPGCPLHNIPGGWHLRGPLDVEALRRAIAAIFARHETLRTNFLTQNGEPVLVIHDEVDVDVPLYDLRTGTREERERELAERIQAEVHQPFDLASDRLVRFVLYQLDDEEHAILILPHHIVWDAWSFDIALAELAQLYEADIADRDAELPALEVQYADFAAWERDLLRDDALRADIDFWREKLGDGVPFLELPTDLPRPAAISYRGTSELLPIPDALVAKLIELGRSEKATLYMTVLAAVKAFMHRLTGQTDLAVGCPIENTTRPEIEPLIGYFVNMLVTRSELRADMSFRELVRVVRENSLDAFTHQSLPFEQLVEELSVARDRSRNPLFQVMFLYQDASARPRSFGPVELTQFNVPMGSSQTDLHFVIKAQVDDWTLALDYSTDLFSPVTARRLLAQFRDVLEALVEAPDRPLCDALRLSDAERHEVVVAWNETAREIPEVSVPARIRERIAATPDAVAFEAHDGAFTYREFGERVDVIARRIAASGVAPHGIVAVCLERGIDLPAALLGVLTAGAAYVPIDPQYPAERQRAILESSGATLVVTSTTLESALPATAAKTLCIDRAPSEGANDPPLPGDLRIDGDDVAYIIYTSGSTGKPKGVEVTHANLANFLDSMAEEPGLGPEDRLLALTTISFDIAALELFLPVWVGARSVVADSASAMDGRTILHLIEQHEITTLQATPVTWRMIVDAGWPATPLRVLSGGEALAVDLAHELTAHSDEVWNLYGPTETTVWSTCQRLSSGDALVVAGRPIANTRLYILDEAGEPVPAGVPGELYIGGAGVARGYHGQPDLTAARFVEDPFANEPNARMYRTGDIARFHGDGLLQWLHRADDQVKIRGFRVELGEIEGLLREHPRVHSAVASVREDREGDQRLVAYYVPADDAEPPRDELRELLRSRLPYYMVPQHFVALEELPLTPNGKIDRARLPAPTQSRARPATTPARRSDPREWVQRVEWVESELRAVDRSISLLGDWLVFADEAGIGAELAAALRTEGARVVTVSAGDSFVELSPEEYWLNPSLGREEYDRLLASLARRGFEASRVVHCWLVTDEETCRPGSSFFQRNQEHGFYSLLALTQAMARRSPDRSLETLIVSSDMHSDVGGASARRTHPEKATALGVARVVPRLLENFAFASVDLSGAQVGEDIVDALLAELCHPTAESVALSGGRRWVRRYVPLPANELARRDDVPVVAGASYMITDGLSPSGLLAAEALARTAPVHAVLLSHEPVAPRDEWSDEREAAIERIETLGSTVSVISGVVSDVAEMRSLRERLLAESRAVRGVIHNDAITRPGRLLGKTDRDVEAVFTAQIHGALVVESLFESGELDFVVSLREDPFGALEPQVDSAAAAAFLDAWAAARPQSVAIEAPAVDECSDELAASLLRTLQHSFRRSAASGMAVSMYDLNAEIPTGDSRWVAPRDELEVRLSEFWEECIGTGAFSVRDDFFSVGGHSLVAVRLMTMINSEFGLEYPLATLFDAPTIESLAARLRRDLKSADEACGGKATEPARRRYVVPMSTPREGSGTPIFVVAGAYGNVLNLRQLAVRVGERRPFYGIQARGLLGDDNPHESFEEMAADYLREVREVQPEGPYILGGFCSGGIIAYEMAQQLQREGQTVELLVFLDTLVPRTGERLRLGDRLKLHRDRVKSRGVRHIFETGKRWVEWRLRREPKPSSDPASYRSEAIYDATFRAMAEYEPDPYSGRVALFRPPLDIAGELGDGRRIDSKKRFVHEDNGWKKYIADLEVHELPARPGDHDGAVLEPVVETLARQLRRVIAAACSKKNGECDCADCKTEATRASTGAARV